MNEWVTTSRVAAAAAHLSRDLECAVKLPPGVVQIGSGIVHYTLNLDATRIHAPPHTTNHKPHNQNGLCQRSSSSSNNNNQTKRGREVRTSFDEFVLPDEALCFRAQLVHGGEADATRRK
jgi:hypothetical protein